jgi:hypothetical protein
MRRQSTLSPQRRRLPASAKFSVASTKLAAPNSGQFMFGVRPMPGGRISAVNVTLRMLIERAYGLQGFQLSGGPGWADTVVALPSFCPATGLNG